MTWQDMAALVAHITNCDFPEEVNTFRRWPGEAGFHRFACLWDGAWHSHKLLQLDQLR